MLKYLRIKNITLIFTSDLKTNKMKALIKQKQVVAIYENSYNVVFTSKNENEVKEFAIKNRTELKNQGALKVITNNGFYEV